MRSDRPDRPTVLVVDDDPQVTATYVEMLADRCEVWTAAGGSEALERLGDGVDVVLLDRRMPDVSGDEVLARIHERGLGCRVALVTAAPPDVDVIEIGYDDYLRKPVGGDELRATVDRLMAYRDYDSRIRECAALARTRGLLESGDAPDGALREVERRLERCREPADRAVSAFDDHDFKVAFRDVGARGAPDPGE